MNEADLKQELQLLHDQLESSLSKTALEKDALGHVMRDIVLIYEGDEPAYYEEPRSLRQALDELASEYEVDHPSVAGAIRQILDVLARIGI